MTTRARAHLPVPATVQSRDFACGPACLLALLLWEDPGCTVSEDDLVRDAQCGRGGSDLADVVAAARKHGLDARTDRLDRRGLVGCLDRGWPVVVAFQAWGGPHFAVAVGHGPDGVVLMDPAMDGARGLVQWPSFVRRWVAGAPEEPGWCAVVRCRVRDVARDALVRCAPVPEEASLVRNETRTWRVPVRVRLTASGAWNATGESPWRAARNATEDLSGTRLDDRAGWHVLRVDPDTVSLGQPELVRRANSPDLPLDVLEALEDHGALSPLQDEELAAVREARGLSRRYRVWWEEDCWAQGVAHVQAPDEERAGAAAWRLATSDRWWDQRPEARIEPIAGTFRVPTQPVGASAPVRGQAD